MLILVSFAGRGAYGELVWQFKDLPDRMIGAFGQLESAWPVHGSILVKDDVAYFAAGRSSQVDGGIFLYGLDAATGEVLTEIKPTRPSEEFILSGQTLLALVNPALALRYE